VEYIPNEQQGSVFEQGSVGGIAYEMHWRFFTHTPRIDWSCLLNLQGQTIGRVSEDPRDPYSAFVHDQKLRLAVHPDFAGPTAGWEHHPFLIADNDAATLQGVYWSAVTSRDVGMAVLNGGNMGLLREPDGSLSVPLAFSMNYIWNTVFLTGRYRYTLGLLPLRGALQPAELQRHALEFHFPLVAVATEALERPLGKRWSPLQLETDAVLLTALFRRHGTSFARLWACASEPQSAQVLWLGQHAELTETDFPGTTSFRCGNPVHFAPWQVRTIGLGPARPPFPYPDQALRKYPDPPAADWRQSTWLAENR
jgi:hypothetical protein